MIKKLKNNKEHCIYTYSGKMFNIINPKKNELNINDAAHALSLQCRFNGHVRKFYSVASHLIIGSKLINEKFKKEFLLHDLQEAWIGDVITPVKKQTKEFIKIENNIEKVISKKFNTPYPNSKEVKEMDIIMFRMESVYLMGQKKNKNEKFPMTKKKFLYEINKSNDEIKKEFLKTFNELNKK